MALSRSTCFSLLEKINSAKFLLLMNYTQNQASSLFSLRKATALRPSAYRPMRFLRKLKFDNQTPAKQAANRING